MNTTEEIRPDPDKLLESIRQEEQRSKRGKLKIFFGMCAGVGKTFSMLQTARTDKGKEVDIVIGYIETHNRPETLALMEGLEIIPRQVVVYKSTAFEEMDLDAVIARNPRIAVVDELAHTNTPGSRHLKRYQDVQELLQAGIDVYTTLNVQHLESRADTVFQITGIQIRETLPDELFEKADEVELVDIIPDELLERLNEGKVYTPERSLEAIQNFFRKGNITALREMALRLVADRVDKQLREYMHQKRIPGPWKSGLRLMALVGPSPYSARLIRWAKQLSYTMGAQLLALYIEEPAPLSPTSQEQLNKNLSLVRQLEIDQITTSGNDRVKTILSIAHQENITHIIVGKPHVRNIFSLFRLGNFVQRLIRHSGKIDVYVLGSDQSSDRSYVKFIAIPTFSSRFEQYVISLFILGLSSVGCYLFADKLGYQTVSFIFLMLVSILATFMGIGPVLVASVFSALVWDYFFIPPKFTFHIGRPEDVLMFGMFFFIALVNGVLTSRVRKQEKLTRDREERANALFQLTRDLAIAGNLSEVVAMSVRNIEKYFGVSSLILVQDGDGKLKNHSQPDELGANDFSIAMWSFRNKKRAGKFSDTLPSTDFSFYPLTGIRIDPGVVRLRLKKPVPVNKEQFLETFLAQISSAMEREFLDDVASKVQLLNESDKLYKTLFNSLSHELRIPVATIMGATETLLNIDLDENNRRVLTEDTLTAADRLNRLIENLLNMSRLESGRIIPHLDWFDIHDLVAHVRKELKRELQPYEVMVIIPDDTPLIKLDYGLIYQVLYNLVVNATQYSSPGTTIRIKAFYDDGIFHLQIMDRGPGFPQESIPQLFDKFYRVVGSKPGGTGLGLSIVKGFIEAHNGTVVVETRQNGGARFRIAIPAESLELSNTDQIQRYDKS